MIDFTQLAALLTTGDPLSLAGNSASIAGFFMTMVQWLTSARQTKEQLTIDSYLDWLRRQEHKDLAERIAHNAQLLGTTTALIEDVKASVLDAIFTHERNSADRHQQIVELIQASQRVESPVLRLTIDQPLGTSTTFGTQTAQYYVRVVAVNNSRSKATILSAVAHLEADHRTATAELDRRKSTVEVPENNGSATLSFETRNQQPQVNWQLARIELRLAQDAGATRTYMPQPGGTFQQV